MTYRPGGDPGTRRQVRAGLPPPRLDQLYRPPPPQLAGSTAGLVRARLVEVFGPSAGVFLYSPTIGPGNLIASGTTGFADPVGNKTLGGGWAVYNNGASAAAVLTGNSVSGYAGSEAAGWTFAGATVAFNENVLALIAGGSVGGSAQEIAILGPSGDTSGATDSTVLGFLLGARNFLILLTPGVFTFNAAWLPNNGTRILGCGRNLTSCTWTGTGAVNTGAQATEDVEIAGVAFTVPNAAGDDIFFGNSFCRRWHVHDCLFNVGTNVAIWNSPVTQLMIECNFERNVYAGASGRALPLWFISANSNATQANVLTWEDERCLASDTAFPVWHLVATGAGVVNAGHYWKRIVCEGPYGGILIDESGQEIHVDDVQAWDTTANIQNSLYIFQQNAAGPAQAPSNILITKSGRNGAPNFAGPTVYDFQLDATCRQVTFDTPRGSTSLRLNGGGCTGLKLINMPAGTVLTNVAASAVPGAQAGAGAPAPVLQATFSSEAGSWTFGTGTGPAAGQQVVVTFGCPSTAIPAIGVDPINAATEALGIYVDSTSVSATGFAVYCINAPAASQPQFTYGFRWRIFQ